MWKYFSGSNFLTKCKALGNWKIFDLGLSLINIFWWNRKNLKKKKENKKHSNFLVQHPWQSFLLMWASLRKSRKFPYSRSEDPYFWKPYSWSLLWDHGHQIFDLLSFWIETETQICEYWQSIALSPVSHITAFLVSV